MALSEIQQAQVAKRLTAFCDSRVPPAVSQTARAAELRRPLSGFALAARERRARQRRNRLDVRSFVEIEQEFIQRAHAMVYCSCATIDTRQRPRSRVLHPIWEGATGWIATGRNSPKSRHLSGNSFVSLAYIADPVRPIYVDCLARWEESVVTKRRIWELFKSTAPPLGYLLAVSGEAWRIQHTVSFGSLHGASSWAICSSPKTSVEITRLTTRSSGPSTRVARAPAADRDR